MRNKVCGQPGFLELPKNILPPYPLLLGTRGMKIKQFDKRMVMDRTVPLAIQGSDSIRNITHRYDSSGMHLFVRFLHGILRLLQVHFSVTNHFLQKTRQTGSTGQTAT